MTATTPSSTLERPESALGWELRTAWMTQRDVRLVLDDRCDGVYPNEEGQRVLQGRLTRVTPTNAFCVMHGRHVPLSAIQAVLDPHHSMAPPSDPADPMDRESYVRSS